MSYIVTYVGSGEIIKQRKSKLAPSPSRLVQMAPTPAEYAVRYYPSVKAYRVYRVIECLLIMVSGQVHWKPDLKYTNQSEDAAILWAIFQSSRN